MSGERFTLDTNILVYAADHLAGAKHELAIELMDRAMARDCVLTVQSLAEFYHAATRKGIVPVREAAGLIRDWMQKQSHDTEEIRRMLGRTPSSSKREKD